MPDNTALDKCLCCGQPVTAPGLTREALLTKHRAQLDYQSPGFVE